MTILAIISSLVAIITGIFAFSNRRKQSPKPTMAKANPAKGIQETLDSQTPVAKPKKLPVPNELTKKELEALADESDE